MKRLILAYNPVSGNASFVNKLDFVIGSFAKRKMMILPYRTTKDNSDFADFVKGADAVGIIAAGGDGTLNGIVNAMMRENIKLPLGIIGSGTSNDFATYLGLSVPFRDNDETEQYFDRIAQGITRVADLGKAGNKYFINVASAGMMTSIAHKTEPRLKNALGKFAYYWGGLKELPKFKSFALNITADGKHYKTDAFLFVIVNSNVVGSLKNISEQVKIDDGKLDLLAVKKTGAAELMKLAKDLFAGNSADGNDNVLHLAAKNFVVDTKEELVGDLDGEKGSALPLVVETVPQAIELFC